MPFGHFSELQASKPQAPKPNCANCLSLKFS